jgi:type IV pilus assembly protein PilB
MARRKPGKLGEILLATALITTQELDQAIVAQSRTGKRLGQILIEQGAATEDDVAWALSNQLMYPYVFLNPDLVDAEAVRLLPEPFLRERHVLPIHRFGQQLTLAMADPTDERTVDDVVARTGLQVNRAVALESNIEEMLRRLPLRGARGAPGGRASRGPEAQYLQFHLLHALQEGASEIHFDPPLADGRDPASRGPGVPAGDAGPATGDGQHRVRYRLHGTLVDRAGHPGQMHGALLRHLREFAGLPDAPAAAGAVSVGAGGFEAHAAVAIVAGAAGPSATISLYPYRDGVPDLLPLGVDRPLVEMLHSLARRTRGALVVGCPDPVLRAALLRAALGDGGRLKICALETLPLYRHPAITQIPVESGLRAASLLAAGLCAGADIVCVDDAGERAALRAALECARSRCVVIGHPEGALAGLAAQVVEAAGPALAASTLGGLAGAQKIRLLCSECKERLRRPAGAGAALTFAPRGCAACGFTGFRGIRALCAGWVLGRNDRARLGGPDREAVLRAVREASQAALRRQGRALLDDGLTSIEELAHAVATEGV